MCSTDEVIPKPPIFQHKMLYLGKKPLSDAYVPDGKAYLPLEEILLLNENDKAAQTENLLN